MAAVAAVSGGSKRRGSTALSIDWAEEESGEARVGRLIRENPVVIFSRQGCCMSHVMKLLLAAVGTHPTSIELEEEAEEEAAAAVAAGSSGLPALFVSGVAVGGLEGLMGLHLRDRLVPMLWEAGALR